MQGGRVQKRSVEEERRVEKEEVFWLSVSN
jgi:hypothetical protein